MRKVIFDGEYCGSASAEKIYTYVNNNHCPGNRAKYRVDSHKYVSDTHSAHSVWIEYFFSLDQLKRCFHHNNYMDAEKFYVRDGRSWVEFNYDYEAEEKAETEKVDNEVITEAEAETPTEVEEKIEKIAELINMLHGIKLDYTPISSKWFKMCGIAWDNMPEFFTEIYESHESGKWVVATEIFDNDYNTITKNKFESDYECWSKKAVKDFAEVIYNEVNTGLVVKTDDNIETEAVPDEEPAPAEEPASAETEVATTKYKVDWKVTKNGYYSEINSIVFKSKDNADNFIAIMKAEGYEIVKWDDDSYIG